MNDVLISSVNIQSVSLAIIGGTLLCWETGDWFSFDRWALSILDSISSRDLWGIIVCISFARILLVMSQDSLSDSWLMFQKMRVFLRFQFLVSSRSSWMIFKWFSSSTILLFNESMSKVCHVIISVFSEIRYELISPSLIARIAEFSTALIEFLMSSYWENILFSTNVIRCSRFTNFLNRIELSVCWESLFDFGIFKVFCIKNNLTSLTVLIWVRYIQHYNLLSPLLQWYLWINRAGLLWMIAAPERRVKLPFWITEGMNLSICTLSFWLILYGMVETVKQHWRFSVAVEKSTFVSIRNYSEIVKNI